MKRIVLTTSVVAALSAFASTANAASVSIETFKNAQYLSKNGIATRIRNGVEDYDTSVSGTDLVGMSVKATFSDGSSELLAWQDTSAAGHRQRGGVSGLGFSLSFEPGAWTLSASSLLTGLEIDAASGGAFFDILAGRKSGTMGDTLGSKVGSAYTVIGGDTLSGEIAATYSNAIHFRDVDRGTDLFKVLSVDYSNLVGGGLFGTTLFKTDLDPFKVAGDLSQVPLPGGLALMLGGIAGLGVMRRKKSTIAGCTPTSKSWKTASS